MARFKSHFTLSPAEYQSSRSGHFAERRVDYVCRAISGAPEAAKILEIGCGTGDILDAVAERFSHSDCWGIDLDKEMICFAQETFNRSNLTFRRTDIADGQDLPKPFGFAYSIDVIHHFHDHESAFRSVRELLSPRAVWLAVEPNIWHPYVTFQQERMIRSGLDEGHFAPWRMRPLLRRAGFDVHQVRFAHVLPPSVKRAPTWLARAEQRIERTRFSGASVLYTLVAR